MGYLQWWGVLLVYSRRAPCSPTLTFAHQIFVGESHYLWTFHLFSGGPFSFYVLCKKPPNHSLKCSFRSSSVQTGEAYLAAREQMGWPWKAVLAVNPQTRVGAPLSYCQSGRAATWGRIRREPVKGRLRYSIKIAQRLSYLAIAEDELQLFPRAAWPQTCELLAGRCGQLPSIGGRLCN